jgi:hypothetical protein
MKVANIVVKTGDKPGVRIVHQGKQIRDLPCSVESNIMDECNTIRDCLNRVAKDISILRGCCLEIVKTDKSKVFDIYYNENVIYNIVYKLQSVYAQK